MSGAWRAAVEYHAVELNPHLSMILSLIADGADEAGEARLNVDSVAWRARTTPTFVRKAVEDLVEGQYLSKGRKGLQIGRLACPPACPCPQSANVTREAAPALATPIEPPAKPRGLPAILDEMAATDRDYLIRSLERSWRDRFKTEPVPGVIHRLVESAPGSRSLLFHGAFVEYLKRLSDPMYLSLPKFAATWASYLEPAKTKGSAKDENIAAFRNVFEVQGPPVAFLPGDPDL